MHQNRCFCLFVYKRRGTHDWKRANFPDIATHKMKLYLPYSHIYEYKFALKLKTIQALTLLW